MAVDIEVRSGSRREGFRRVWAAVLYGALLVASLTTLDDWRIRLVTVAVILLFAGRTLWQPRRTEAPAPWGRRADVPPVEADLAGEDSPM